jgi:hypothetical protein
MQEPEQKKKALIVVRTYPTPAKKGVEVSCTAAITEGGEWLRLFPVPWRLLPEDQRFRRYQWIEVGVTKSKDHRPESHRIVRDSIRILEGPIPTDHEWRARKDIIFPLRAHCLCCLKKQLEANGRPTLGLFRPKRIERLRITPIDLNWTQAQLSVLRQGHLFEEMPQRELEKVPYDFQYQFFCNESTCVNGHTLICTDWELGESWRKWRREYGENWEAAFRQKFEAEMINKYDTHFFVGTMHQHPNVWIIVGLFYPPKGTERLFDLISPSQPPL